MFRKPTNVAGKINCGPDNVQKPQTKRYKSDERKAMTQFLVNLNARRRTPVEKSG